MKNNNCYNNQIQIGDIFIIKNMRSERCGGDEDILIVFIHGFRTRSDHREEQACKILYDSFKSLTCGDTYLLPKSFVLGEDDDDLISIKL